MPLLPESDLQDMFDNPDKYDDRKILTDYEILMNVPTVGYAAEVLKNDAEERCSPEQVIKDGGQGYKFIFKNLEDAEEAHDKLLAMFQDPSYSSFNVQIDEPKKYEHIEQPVDEEISYDFGTVNYDVSIERIKNLGGMK